MNITLKTSAGDITLELYEDKAPKTVENFLSYIDKGHYDNTIFHRVIDGFMIQGGGMDTDFQEKETDDPIKNEANNGLGNERGTVAMARTMVVDSATSQFFINVKDNQFLDFKNETPQGYGYCVFGKVVDGMDTVDKIKKAPTGNHGPHSDVPKENITIESVEKAESK